MKCLFTFLCCALFSFAAVAQRDTIAVNDDWTYAADKKAEGLAGKWFEKALPGARIVQLPHTWSVEKETGRHYGWGGLYQKKINMPTNWKNKNVVLQFGAINHTSYINENGQKVAENIGDGFNKFYVNLNGKLRYGQENTITVAVNNDYGRMMVVSFSQWP